MKIVRRAQVSGVSRSTCRRKRVDVSTPARRPVNAAIDDGKFKAGVWPWRALVDVLERQKKAA